MNLAEATKVLAEAIQSTARPDWVEWIPMLAVVVIVLGLGYTARQLREMKRNNELAEAQLAVAVKQTEAAKMQFQTAKKMASDSDAMVVLRIDRAYEGADIRESRVEVFKFGNEVMDGLAATAAYQGATPAQRIDLYKIACGTALQEMESANRERYLKIILLVGFFETLGYLAKNNSDIENHVRKLYSGALTILNDVAVQHIKAKAAGMPVGYMEFFLSLAEPPPNGGK